MLQQAPKGSLVIHALVPGMCNKGQRDPKLARRARLVADAISELWKKRFPAARKASNKEQLLLLLQIMQFSPERRGGSVSLQMSKRHDALAQSKLFASRAGQC